MVNINEEYSFEPLTAENVHLLIFLYKKVFGNAYSIEQIKQKYLSNHTGIKAQGHFAFFDGDVVAFHGAIPVLMEHKGEVQLAAQYGDAMTLKEHTGKGLFTKLGNLTDELLQRLKVKFVWGFPNQNSEYGYVNKLNWKGKKRMNCYIFPIKKVSSEQLTRKTRLFSKIKQEQIQKKLLPILQKKGLDGSVDFNASIGTYRNQVFYNYRNFSSNYVVKIFDTLVWLKTEGGLLIGDISFHPDNDYELVLDELKRWAKKLDLHQLVFQVTPNTALDQFLKKQSNAVESWLIGYKNFNSEWDLNQLELTYGDLDTF